MQYRRSDASRQGFRSGLARAAASDSIDGATSGHRTAILAHRDALWTFVARDGVDPTDPTNNHAERELRAFVLWRRRSFCSQSKRGERFAERVMTVAHTARKQGIGLLDFITDCCRASMRGTAPPTDP